MNGSLKEEEEEEIGTMLDLAVKIFWQQSCLISEINSLFEKTSKERILDTSVVCKYQHGTLPGISKGMLIQWLYRKVSVTLRKLDRGKIQLLSYF